MTNDIKSSSGKIIGSLSFKKGCFIINTFNKPLLTMDNEISSRISKERNSGSPNNDTLIKLYDEYTLTNSEIAALYGMNYHNMNALLKSLNTTSARYAGRRNSSYGLEFSEERLKHMSESQQGNVPVGYVRTDEIKKKISDTLKSKYASGELVQDPAKKSQAWRDGKYDYSPMGTGLQGYFYSKKCPKIAYFRSSFELYYMILLDDDDNVQTFISEPFKIPISDSSVYIPDLLVNNKVLIELKKDVFGPRLMRTGRRKELKRFLDEQMAAMQYCLEHNLDFMLVYGSRIGFNSSKFKRCLINHPEIIERYHIEFTKGLS